MVEQLKELYNNIDVNYNRIELYYKNLKEKNDWYYKQLILIYEENEKLSIEKQIEECHGEQIIYNYTNEALIKINNFINNLNKLIDGDNNKNNFNYNSSKLVN